MSATISSSRTGGHDLGKPPVRSRVSASGLESCRSLGKIDLPDVGVTLELLAEARAAGLTTSLDTNWDPAGNWAGVADCLPHLDVFPPNAAEAVAIARALGQRPADAEAWRAGEQTRSRWSPHDARAAQTEARRPRLFRPVSTRRQISGVKISCMASSILPPGTTMLLALDMNEASIIDSR